MTVDQVAKATLPLVFLSLVLTCLIGQTAGLLKCVIAIADAGLLIVALSIVIAYAHFGEP